VLYSVDDITTSTQKGTVMTMRPHNRTHTRLKALLLATNRFGLHEQQETIIISKHKSRTKNDRETKHTHTHQRKASPHTQFNTKQTATATTTASGDGRTQRVVGAPHPIESNRSIVAVVCINSPQNKNTHTTYSVLREALPPGTWVGV
jgi:hypothetical protein